MDKSFIKWFLMRVEPYRDVPSDKLTAEREAMRLQTEYNQNYADFMNSAVLPAVERLVNLLNQHRITHRVSTWGNQLAIRIHLTWRWGELLISQSHDDQITFDHHVTAEGERQADDRSQDYSHHYDLHDAIPAIVAQQELTFFLTRIAQDISSLLEPAPPESNP